MLNVAVTVIAEFMAIVHEPVPVQAPDQPAKTEPAAAVAVSVTLELPSNWVVQVAAQFIPPTALVTCPAPVPALTKFSVAWVVPQATGV